jgi:hypothetical protein
MVILDIRSEAAKDRNAKSVPDNEFFDVLTYI